MDKELELSWKAGPSFDPYEKDINKVAEHLQKVYEQHALQTMKEWATEFAQGIKDPEVDIAKYYRYESVQEVIQNWVEFLKGPEDEFGKYKYEKKHEKTCTPPDIDDMYLDLSFVIGTKTTYEGKEYTIVNVLNTKTLPPEEVEKAQANLKTCMKPNEDNIFLHLENEDEDIKIVSVIYKCDLRRYNLNETS